MKTRTFRFELLDKLELRVLCDGLLADDSDVVERCVAFFEVETTGLWHGRARAMMARRFKHCRLSNHQHGRVVQAILGRLESGRFFEQFKDQLRFVLHVEPQSAFTVARSLQRATAEHVRRYATWILSHEPPDGCA